MVTWNAVEVKLKLKWTNHCALSANSNVNDYAYSNNIIFTIKDTKLYIEKPQISIDIFSNQTL